jgi:hypothetical protein
VESASTVFVCWRKRAVSPATIAARSEVRAQAITRRELEVFHRPAPACRRTISQENNINDCESLLRWRDYR